MAVTAYVLIQTDVGKAADVARQVRAIDGVVSAEDVTGPYDVIARADAESVDDLGPAGGEPDPADRGHHPHRHLPGGQPLTDGRRSPRPSRPPGSADPPAPVAAQPARRSAAMASHPPGAEASSVSAPATTAGRPTRPASG